MINLRSNRTTYNADGTLDEVVTDGGAHLEQMDADQWFLSCSRADGSEFCVWIRGEIMSMEERPATEKGAP